MDCARINCAHDSAPAWTRMIADVRKVAEDVGRSCLVAIHCAIDLAGPKPRTVLVADGPRVARLQPSRDEFGRVTKPGRRTARPT